MKINQVYLGLGSNLGERQANLDLACIRIAETIGAIVAQSSIYETAAWGLKEQNDFLNQVICINTEYEASEVLTRVLAVEQSMGRIREVKWGARIIDIDLLYYNADIIQLNNLTIPHPFIQERRFVLTPLAEIAPDFIHPQWQQTNATLLANCTDTSEVIKKQ
ncbi:2-amino-4-hydroxy-6-hydroxymethyldihydropteridine diphosphokinase [Emticicia agri]|uniref:2-amino-4-hydroxy-6-hydroxymethyldihydropteridine pyrophosphokinase n=1 Tax=Emticicia agri TaxID=2492393 RepID=A0A4Q5LXQ0_9BACT|nr:2-amino-4-hydroxy-6-hydroxymethyldihydropteridine diphosphokinase [Emticicia agri]RYU94542.1 2-amino-4-hydroxy-6-hydroxymethyldihydropteridine diphosphokinase [Emticicia agri]